jgi:hypothetical protein
MENTMNRNIALALALGFAAAGAIADDITVDPNPFVSTATRAQVRQELRDFRNTGVNPWADGYNPVTQFRSSLTRAEVRDDFLASRNTVAAFSAEDSGSIYLARAMKMPRVRHTELARGE